VVDRIGSIFVVSQLSVNIITIDVNNVNTIDLLLLFISFNLFTYDIMF